MFLKEGESTRMVSTILIISTNSYKYLHNTINIQDSKIDLNTTVVSVFYTLLYFPPF